jgi:photosystem II stability/assembly factor-like uncharacterized protein
MGLSSLARTVFGILLALAPGARGAGAESARVLAPIPLYGADVRSLVFDPSDPDRAFAGTSAGHVYRSDDGGETWRDAGAAAPFPGWVVSSLRFDPHRTGRVWAGLWGVWGGGSVAYSDDSGATWTRRADGLAPGDQVYTLALVPGVPGRVLAATRTGVWASDDDGGRWRKLSGAAPELVHASSLLVDARDPQRILAGTWRRAFRSDDGGATWRGAFEGMVLDTEVFALEPVPGGNGDLWASTCGWVYRGEDFGTRWSRVKAGFGERRTPSLLVVSPERVLAGTVAGLHVSADGGRTFRRTSDARLAVLALAHHPARPERVLVGTEGAGVWLSEDSGETLAPRLVATANVRVTALAAADETVFAALAHAGPLSGVYRSPDHGASFEPRPTELPTVLDLAIARGGPLAATERGLYERSGSEWRQVGELGTARVEQLAVAGERAAARTRDSVWESEGGRFRKLLLPRGVPEGIAFAWGDLWVEIEGHLWRVGRGGEPEAASLPGGAALVPGGADRLVAVSGDGVFVRLAPDGAWEHRIRGGARVLDTRDGRFPAVVVRDGEIYLFESASGVLAPLEAAFPADTVRAALVAGDRLLIGTSGYGLWGVELRARAAEGRVAGAQPAPSEASIRR